MNRQQLPAAPAAPDLPAVEREIRAQEHGTALETRRERSVEA